MSSREGVRVLAQELMELDLAEHVGAERLERTAERSGYRERPEDNARAESSSRCRGVCDGSCFPRMVVHSL